MSSTSVNTDPGPVELSPDSSGEIGKANLYLSLSRIFSSPLEMDRELPRQFLSLIPDLPTSVQDESLKLAQSWERALENRTELTLAYARLFLGPFEVLASPYASFYIEPDQRLMGKVSQYVARAYAEAGLEPGPSPREAPDHVALEWEFMYYLTHQYIVSGDDHWLELRNTFLVSHLERWIPSLAEAIAQTEEHEFYSAAATLLTSVLGITSSEYRYPLQRNEGEDK